MIHVRQAVPFIRFLLIHSVLFFIILLELSLMMLVLLKYLYTFVVLKTLAKSTRK